MARRCRPVFVEGNVPLRIGERLRAAWNAWKTSALCPAGEASWSNGSWLASLRSDGRLEVIEKTGREREVVLSAGGSRYRSYEGRNRPERPSPHWRECNVRHIERYR